MYDYHLHSQFSDDCVEEMEDTILEAIKMGGKQLCFTDHLDYDYPDQSVKFEFNIEGFNEMIESLKVKYKDKLLIQKGIEVGLQPHVISRTETFIKEFNPEFVLCSFHVADRKDLYTGDFFVGRSSEEAWDKYLDDIIETLTQFKDYSVVGHLDILKRYNDGVKLVPYSYYGEKVDTILKMIIDDDRGIEVNMSGLRTPMNETLPHMDIVKRYYELGGKYITIGSDAHMKEDIYSHFNEMLKKLYDIGFEYFTIYKNRIPKQISIKSTLEN